VLYWQWDTFQLLMAWWRLPAFWTLCIEFLFFVSLQSDVAFLIDGARRATQGLKYQHASNKGSRPR